MSRWFAVMLLIATLPIAVIATACSPTVKHKVLSFFLDGVPPLETSEPPPLDEPINETVKEILQPTLVQYFPHTPYQNNRCDGCHDMNRGELIKPLDEGLCLTCHTPLVASLRFLHGPVAVDACVECHHYHTSPYPNLLLDEPVAICLKCHDASDLTKEDYHDNLQQRKCTECHDPHGGDNRFFVRRGAR